MFEFFSLKETLTATMVLFAVIDIVGSIPIIVGLKKKFGKIESEKFPKWGVKYCRTCDNIAKFALKQPENDP